jgi:hypothetical protein
MGLGLPFWRPAATKCWFVAKLLMGKQRKSTTADICLSAGQDIFFIIFDKL